MDDDNVTHKIGEQFIWHGEVCDICMCTEIGSIICLSYSTCSEMFLSDMGIELDCCKKLNCNCSTYSRENEYNIERVKNIKFIIQCVILFIIFLIIFIICLFLIYTKKYVKTDRGIFRNYPNVKFRKASRIH